MEKEIQKKVVKSVTLHQETEKKLPILERIYTWGVGKKIFRDPVERARIRKIGLKYIEFWKDHD